jgi:hypothetical protein
MYMYMSDHSIMDKDGAPNTTPASLLGKRLNEDSNEEVEEQQKKPQPPAPHDDGTYRPKIQRDAPPGITAHSLLPG